MNKYNLIVESLQKSLDNGEITLEEAEVLNDYVYDRYIEEKTALQKRVEDDDEYDKIHDYVVNKKDSEKDEKKRKVLNEIDDSIFAKRERNSCAKLVRYNKKNGDDDEVKRFIKLARQRKEEYDIKPHEYRKPNTYYNAKKGKEKFNELVKKYNYDPKTKTIEIDGTRTPIRYIHDNDDSNYKMQTRYGKHMLKNMIKDARCKSKKSEIGNTMKKLKNDNYKGITINKSALNDFDNTINHENQHAKDASLRRMMEREPRFDTKYGTSGLDEDTRRKLLKVKKEYMEYRKSHKGHENKFTIDNFEDRIEELLDKSKKKTKEYKTDKNEKRKDKRKEFSKKVREYLDSPNNKKLKDNMNSHDRDDMEFYADLGAMKHGKDKEYTIKTQRNDEKMMKKSKETHNTNVARRETRNELKKRGLMNYVESFDN